MPKTKNACIRGIVLSDVLGSVQQPDELTPGAPTSLQKPTLSLGAWWDTEVAWAQEPWDHLEILPREGFSENNGIFFLRAPSAIFPALRRRLTRSPSRRGGRAALCLPDHRDDAALGGLAHRLREEPRRAAFAVLAGGSEPCHLRSPALFAWAVFLMLADLKQGDEIKPPWTATFNFQSCQPIVYGCCWRPWEAALRGKQGSGMKMY